MIPRGRLTLLDHPLVDDALARLRDESTAPEAFTREVDRLALHLALAATRDLPTRAVELRTPLERVEGRVLRDPPPALVPILRAGLGMVRGVRSLIPDAPVGHLGMERDHETLEPRSYYAKLPDRLGERCVLLLDPMLATGGSASAALEQLYARGARRVRFLCLVAATEGVERLLGEHPELEIFTAAVDRALDENGYILPGLGDAGDRLYGTL